MMKTMKSCLFFLLILSLCSTVSGLGSVLVKNVSYVQKHYTWNEAQASCRRDYTDLVTIYDQSYAEDLDLQTYKAWVGLTQSNTSRIWVWTNGYLLDYHFWPQSHNPDYNCAYVKYNNNSSKSLDAAKCEHFYYFICHNNNCDDCEYTFINESRTWSGARQYCQDMYRDLAVINNYQEWNSAVKTQDYPVWIGLYRDGETWKWSASSSDYRKWKPNEPSNNGDCVAIYSLNKTMITQTCSARYPFVCFMDNLLLVKENKTWEEAMEHCQALTSQNNNPYKLVSVQPGEDYRYMMHRVMEADTDEVWTGLHFLAGSWLWINNADMTFSGLPPCPINWRYCGAFSKNNTGSFETRDCLEKKNFLCYSPS